MTTSEGRERGEARGDEDGDDDDGGGGGDDDVGRHLEPAPVCRAGAGRLSPDEAMMGDRGGG